MKTQFYPANERGLTKTHWLTSYHTFSFADYYDPKKVSFGPLRVLNDDMIRPQSGFPMHPHRNMEIVTLVLEGELTHRDTEGNLEVIRAGEMQYMSTGSGTEHSEINYSDLTYARIVQIWLQPNVQNEAPSYEIGAFEFGEGKWQEIVGRSTQIIKQDAELFGCKAEGISVSHTLKRSGAFLYLIDGEAELEGVKLTKGDAVAITETETIYLTLNGRAILFEVEV